MGIAMIVLLSVSIGGVVVALLLGYATLRHVMVQMGHIGENS